MYCASPGGCIPHGGDGREYAGFFGRYGHKRDSVRKDEHEQCCTFFFMVLRCVHDSSLFIFVLHALNQPLLVLLHLYAAFDYDCHDDEGDQEEIADREHVVGEGKLVGPFPIEVVLV